GTDLVLRLTTDASITALTEENPFYLEDTVTMLLGPDETVQGGVADVGRRFLEETAAYWRDWVRSLGIPFEWQDAVIRSAITLQLNVFEDSGAIDSLPGYRGMGPVRVGNQAYRQVQHDVYGAAILAATHVFFDRRLVRRGDEVLFRRLETLGDHAARLFDQPDAGLWELRGTP